MKRFVKIAAGLLMSAALLVGNSAASRAAASDTWKIRYIPGAPSSVSEQYDYATVTYYGDGFVANCYAITGSNGRKLTISSSGAGGMAEVPITTTGLTKSWTMKGSTTGNVTFRIAAESGYSCSANGIIKINK